MSIQRTIEIWRDELSFDRLPVNIRAALSEDEAAAYRGGPSYFQERASNCRYRPLRKFFRLLGKAGSMSLHLYGGMLPEYRVYFGFNLRTIGRYIQLRLASDVALPGDPPPALVQLYEDIGGLIDGREISVLWEEPEEMQSVGARRWQPSRHGRMRLGA